MKSNTKFATPFIIHPANNLLKKHPDVSALANQLASTYNKHNLVNNDDLQRMGESLWQALGIEKEFNQAVKAAKTKVLPIIIATNSPALAKLPWESLYHPKYNHLATSNRFTLSRVVDNDVQADNHAELKELTQELEKGPLKVLLFTSLPDYPETEFNKNHRLNIEEEQAQVLEALLPLIREGKVELTMPDDGRFETLRDTIIEKSPHLVFLSGHGSHTQSLAGQTQAVFEFEDDQGAPKAVAAEDITEAFVGSNVQCVVVSACESAKLQQSSSDGLVQQLSELGINHVVGMSESVADFVGHYFAHYFCKAIGNGHFVASAIQMARQSIAEVKQIPDAIQSKTALVEVFATQWNFPVLYSACNNLPLIDWEFAAEPVIYEQLNIQLHHVAQPKRFIGRRMELRNVQSKIATGHHQWLFIGPGGQGKTALAGKIAHNLLRQNYQVFAWSARKHTSMSSFISELQHKLTDNYANAYDANVVLCKSEYDKALLCLQLLCHQQQTQTPNSKVVLFLDNLESIQDPQTFELTSPQVTAWIEAAQALSNDGLVLILTSRWQMPNWHDEHCIKLAKLHYHDFIMLAQNLNCPAWLLKETGKLRDLYQTLHGNGRGLEFFLAAANYMTKHEAHEFEQELKTAKEELQTNMALEVIVKHLSDDDKTILKRITAYQSPVPEFAVLKLVDALAGITMEKQTALDSIKRLVSCSLLEQHGHQANAEYFCSPVVADWLYSQSNSCFKCPTLSEEVLVAAADSQLELLKSTKRTFEQAVVVYNAYLKTKQKDTAYQFALDNIIYHLELVGMNQSLLDDWMPELLKTQDEKLSGRIIGRTGKIYLNIGDYDTALEYIEQSLTISNKVNDKATESVNLNNISQIYDAKGDYDTALKYLKQSLTINQETDNKHGEGAILNNIAAIHRAIGDLDTALEYLKQTLAIIQKADDKKGEGITLNNISQIYRARDDNSTALQYLKQSLTISQEIGDKQGESSTLNNICTLYHTKGNYDTALEYLKLSLSIKQDIGDKPGICTTLFNMGHMHAQNNEIQQAISAWIEVYSIAKPMGQADILQALEKLAGQIGLEGGLDGWESLYQQAQQEEQESE